MERIKKATVGLVAAGALALGAGVGIAGLASAEPTPTPTPAPSASTTSPGTDAPGRGHLHRGHGHRHGGQRVAALAAKLDVDQAKVREALSTFREANKPTSGERPDRDAMESALAKSLAESLGIDEASVKTALEDIRTARHAERAAALKPRLDEAVSDGTLTQEEADAVTKAVEEGVIGGRR